jgi:hypothetical protein
MKLGPSWWGLLGQRLLVGLLAAAAGGCCWLAPLCDGLRVLLNRRTGADLPKPSCV